MATPSAFLTKKAAESPKTAILMTSNTIMTSSSAYPAIQLCGLLRGVLNFHAKPARPETRHAMHGFVLLPIRAYYADFPARLPSWRLEYAFSKDKGPEWEE